MRVTPTAHNYTSTYTRTRITLHNCIFQESRKFEGEDRTIRREDKIGTTSGLMLTPRLWIKRAERARCFIRIFSSGTKG